MTPDLYRLHKGRHKTLPGSPYPLAHKIAKNAKHQGNKWETVFTQTVHHALWNRPTADVVHYQENVALSQESDNFVTERKSS